MTRQKILILTPYYYPNINPRPYRWTQIANYWASQGFDIQVITEKNPNFESESLLNNVSVHRVGYAALKSIFLKKQRGEASNEKIASTPKRSRLHLVMQYFNDNIWKKLYFPDDSCIWFYPALRKATKVIENQNVKYIISSSLPFTTSVIGLALKQKYPHLVWIADMGDPFAYQTEAPLNNHFFYQQLNFKLEQKILQLADFVTSQTAEKYKAHYPFLMENEKLSIIPPLMTQYDWKDKHFSFDFYEEGKINISYLGKFYTTLREPKVLLDFLDALFEQNIQWKHKIVIHIFGDVFPQFLPAFTSYPMIKIHGLIERTHTINVMQKSDILLNISNLTDYQLPSKAPDYLQSGKPILNIYQTENDEFKSFFKDYPLICNYRKHQAIAPIIYFLENEIGNRVGEEDLRAMLKPYTLEAIGHKYLALLQLETSHQMASDTKL
jgi:hypothetical protein